MTWLNIPPPESRDPLTLATFFRDIATPFLGYYASAIFVLMPNTRAIRIATLPICLWTLFRAATRLDIAKAYNNEALAFLNQSLVVAYTAMGMRLIVWSAQKHHLWRVKSRHEITPDFYVTRPPTSITKQILVDAIELCFNARGCGWSYSRHFHIPEEIRPTSSVEAFASATLASFILHTVVFDLLQYTIQRVEPATVDPVTGGSIFNSNLPLLLRYSRSSFLTLLVGAAAYTTIQAYYDIATLFAVVVCKQDISLWPPIFNAPWLAVSLTEFWGKRWHQLFRDSFIRIGGQPLSATFGRAAGIIGVFTVSGVLHVFGIWGMGRGTDWVPVGGCFVMNGVGVVLEHAWKSVTGRKVGGWLGRMWTLLWLVAWSQTLIEAWSTRGLFGSIFLPDKFRLTTHIFGPLS